MEQRVIKFRAKRIDNRQWIYGWFVGDTLNPELGHMVDYADNAGDSYTMEDVDGTTVGQFTGRFDDNNNEIYECDRVTFWGGEATVIYFAPYGAFQIEYGKGAICGLEAAKEVIGNIYEPSKDPQP